MADYDNYSVPATSVPEPSLEEQAQVIDEIEEAQAEAQAQPQTYEVERPEWLPEKFATVEDMAKAYGELESRMGGQPQEQKEEATEEAPKEGNPIELAYDEYAEKGSLSQETYDALAKQGLNESIVNTYIQGQEALLAQQTADITNEIGGMSEYEKMSAWASENLTESQLAGYNEIVENGTVDQAKFALRSLYKDYQDAGAPRVLQGQNKGNPIPPFQSRAQVVAAMKDPRYEADPAFRKEVFERMSVSGNI